MARWIDRVVGCTRTHLQTVMQIKENREQRDKHSQQPHIHTYTWTDRQTWRRRQKDWTNE